MMYAVMLVAVSMVVAHLHAASDSSNPAVARVSSTMLAAFLPLSLLTLYAFVAWHSRRARRAALHNAGLICRKCDYPMRGLGAEVPNCPECGHPRETP